MIAIKIQFCDYKVSNISRRIDKLNLKKVGNLYATVLAQKPEPMTGNELHQLLVTKWGYSFDVQIRRVRNKMLIQVMWKYLEQASFPMTEAEYMAHLDQVASYISAWGGDLQVQRFIESTRDRPRLGKAVSIPIDLGARASEWLLEEF